MYYILVIECGKVSPMNNKTTITQGQWIADLTAMTCRHIATNLILHFIEEGKSLKPEIQDIPLKLSATIAKKQNDVAYLQKLIEEGKEVFLRASETKTENTETPK
jgi:hypothetical protein